MDTRQICDSQRLDPGRKLDGNATDLVQGRRFRDDSDHHLLLVAVDDAATGVRFIRLHRVGKFAKGHAGPSQRLGKGLDHNLLHVAAIGVDVRYPLNAAQRGADHELLGLIKFHQLFSLRGRLLFRVRLVP